MRKSIDVARLRSCSLTALGIGMAMLAVIGLRDPLETMSGKTASLMLLNQVAPPLILLGIPRSRPSMPAWTNLRRAVRQWLLDPWVSATVCTAFTVAISLPSIFDRGVANALFEAPLGLLELLTGFLLWAQICPVWRIIAASWKLGLWALGCAMPMTIVAVIWIAAPSLLYAPYADVICRWGITPLQDQRWAGFIMLIGCAPLQTVGAWFLAGLATPPTVAGR